MVSVRFFLGSTLGNIVICHFQNKLLKDYPQGLKTKFCWQYVDEIHTLLSPLDHTEKLKEHLSFRYPGIHEIFPKERKR